MAYKVVLTDEAEKDIDQTVTFIEIHSELAAAIWLDAIQQVIESLSQMPQRGALIAENTGQNFEYRHLVYRNHRIVFRVDETAKTVFVVRVYHGARVPLTPHSLE